jgi:membrane protease YdiL (CAAX protease family)
MGGLESTLSAPAGFERLVDSLRADPHHNRGPLFYATVVAASFVYGYLRLYTGSVWPASLAHAVHNAAWGALGAFTATFYRGQAPAV